MSWRAVELLERSFYPALPERVKRLSVRLSAAGRRGGRALPWLRRFCGERKPSCLSGDRGFESCSLQRGVRCEPDFGGESHGISPTPTQRRFSARNDLVILDLD